MTYTRFTVEVADHLAQVRFNRPDKANALDETSWAELQAIFEELDTRPEVRAIVLAGEGKHFCSGIDLSLLASLQHQTAHTDGARSRELLRRKILAMQAPVNAIERCRQPVIAAIHGGCIGAGLDIASACDLRYCTDDAVFCIKEIDVGMVADLGTLQRLPRLVAPGVVAELAYTGRPVGGREAVGLGLANRSFADVAALHAGALAVAQTIAAKSPLAVRGTKEVLRYARDHSVADGLDHIATWNAAMLVSADLQEALQAAQQKRPPVFGN
jgi:enoyl-CoA hydratase